jgi:DNA-binding CsgD family transcriptional regulator
MLAPYPGREPVRDDRLLGLLEALHAIHATELTQVLAAVAEQVAVALSADLANVFVFQPEVTSLVALGTSTTAMGRRQRSLGLDRLPLVNGGRAVQTFRTGEPHLAESANLDPDELRGFVQGLGVCSTVTCAIEVYGERHGVMMIASRETAAFRSHDLRALGVVAGWVGLVMDRADLLARLGKATERREHEEAGHELARLTLRQRQVAALVAEGRSNAEIASRLALAEGTIANHMEQALRRLKIRSRSQLAVWAYRQGLYQPDGAMGDPAGSPSPNAPAASKSSERF